MTKDEFIQSLEAALDSRGIDRELSRDYVAGLKSFFEIVQESENGQVSDVSSVERLADNICEKIKSNTEFVAEVYTDEKTFEEISEAVQINSALGQDLDEEFLVEEDANDEVLVEETKVNIYGDYNPEDDDDGLSIAEEDELKMIPSTPAYKKIFFLTGPLSIILHALIFILFGAGMAVLGAMFIASILVVLVTIVAAVGIDIIGVVYAIGQIIAGQFHVGMFEIGICIAVSGCALLLGTLVYNFAVRLVPFAIRYWNILLRIVLGKIRKIYISAKRRYAK